ncbi:MAG TPA: hypothetical protein PLT66_09430, partial [Bacillota bacterium]|nr:hypothetical protein [Bacillota bacterium]
DGMPYSLGFYSCDVADTVVNEGTNAIGRSYFYALKTSDGQNVPTHEKLFGTTDSGDVFGIADLEGGE